MAAFRYPESAENGWCGDGSWCHGDKQSPVNLISTDARLDKQIPPLKFTYGKLNDMHLVHSGTALTFKLGNRENRLCGGGLAGNYILEQFHLHMSQQPDSGSEHQLDGHAFSMEVHFVHYQDQYTSASDALERNREKAENFGALAVTGLLLRETDGPDNEQLEGLVSAVTAYPSEQAAAHTAIPVKLNPADDNSLLNGKLTEPFYSYDGSLTTPKCNQLVRWFVSKNVVPVSKRQMSELRAKQNFDGRTPANCRDVQPLNGRIVLTNCDRGTHT